MNDSHPLWTSSRGPVKCGVSKQTKYESLESQSQFLPSLVARERL
jgi:hypothetical protein